MLAIHDIAPTHNVEDGLHGWSCRIWAIDLGIFVHVRLEPQDCASRVRGRLPIPANMKTKATRSGSKHREFEIVLLDLASSQFPSSRIVARIEHSCFGTHEDHPPMYVLHDIPR